MSPSTIIKTLFILAFSFIVCPAIDAQVVVERSTEKMIISGVSYYIHNVKKGETSYSISKAYGITVEELIKENPPAVYGIKDGQVLRIPVVATQAPASVPTIKAHQVKDGSKYLYHKLQPGETVYFLSKSYGVSENEIIESNPGIDINKLPVGSEIAIPRKQFMSNRQNLDEQDKNYIYHKVVNGESLSSIAGQYGISVRALRRENRDVRFPQVGSYIRVPGVANVAVIDSSTVTPDTIAVSAANIVAEPVKPAGYTPVVNLKGSLNVAVLLPFYLNENALRTDIDSSTYIKGRKQYKIISRSEDWIYPRSVGFVEMYEGILLAADTLRSLGLDVKLHVYDIINDTIAITNLINSGKLESMDLIIGPVYSSNLAIVARYASRENIPVVSPVPLLTNSVLNGNPRLFMANPSLEVAQNALAKKALTYYDHNFVFIHTDSTNSDKEVKNYKNKILTELTYRIPYEDIKFKEFLFNNRSAFNNDSIDRLSHTLTEGTGNVIVIASEEASVISETIMDIHSLSKKFDIRIFGYPSMRGLDNLDPKYFFDLSLMIYSPFWIDYSKKDVQQFNSDFRGKFLSQPSELSYAWLGYDITYYFLSGLALNGKHFISHPEIHNPDLLHTEFDFRRKNDDDGFENQKLFLIRYAKDYNIQMIDDVTYMVNMQP